MEVLEKNAVEDVVFDLSRAVGGCYAVDCDGGVDLLERPAVDVEFAIEDYIGVDDVVVGEMS